MEKLLRPRSVAIVGASPTPGALGNSVLANLEHAGYAGEILLPNASLPAHIKTLRLISPKLHRVSAPRPRFDRKAPAPQGHLQ